MGDLLSQWSWAANLVVPLFGTWVIWSMRRAFPSREEMDAHKRECGQRTGALEQRAAALEQSVQMIRHEVDRLPEKVDVVRLEGQMAALTERLKGVAEQMDGFKDWLRRVEDDQRETRR